MKRGTFRRWCAGISLCALLAGQLTLPTHAVKFKDVPADHWAAKEISRCAELGIFKGQGDDCFQLGKPMTRAEFVAVVSRYFSWKAEAVKHSSFSDVPMDAWYLSELQAACEHGVVTRSDSLFRPNDPITREEVTVILTRALGYGSVAGAVAENAAVPRDVYSNRGYIGIAYAFGLVNGYNKNTFAPKDTATREQVAVILMRMYDKQRRTDSRMAIISDGETVADFAQYDTLAVPAAELTNKTEPALSLRMEEQQELVAQIHESGKKALLHVTGAEDLWQGMQTEAAALVTAMVIDTGYDGVYLDVDCSTDNLSELAALARALRNAMPEKLIYAAADGPKQETACGGYQILSSAVDRMIIKIPALETSMAGMPVAVMEPLEDVYQALTKLSGAVPADKLFLQITAAASCWSGTRKVSSMSDAELQRAAAQGTVYQSSQYHAAYLRSGNKTIWYLGQQGIEMRERLVKLLGYEGICMTGTQVFSL